MSPNRSDPSVAADVRFRGTITALLFLMIAVMIVRDILMRRRSRLRGTSQRDISLVVR